MQGRLLLFYSNLFGSLSVVFYIKLNVYKNKTLLKYCIGLLFALIPLSFVLPQAGVFFWHFLLYWHSQCSRVLQNLIYCCESVFLQKLASQEIHTGSGLNKFNPQRNCLQITSRNNNAILIRPSAFMILFLIISHRFFQRDNVVYNMYGELG